MNDLPPAGSPALDVPRSLEELALKLAVSHQTLRRAQGKSVPLLDFAAISRSLSSAALELQKPRLDDPIYQKAAEWFLDNHYLLVATLRQVKSDLPDDFRRRLPQVGEDELPRAFRIAQGVVEATVLDFDEATLLEFLGAYQRRAPLAIAELWALPTLLRIAVLQELVRILGVFLPAVRERHGSWDRPIDAAVGMGRAVRALRQLAEIDWSAFFQQTSSLEEALRSDPAGVYPQMDFETRDAYRKVVEELAWGANRSEPEVANLALALASEHTGNPRTGHVGYYLVDQGRARLEQQISYRARGNTRWRRVLLSHPTLAYLGAIWGGSALLTACAGLWGVSRLGLSAALLLCACALVPLSSIAVAFSNWFLTMALPPRTLPKLDFSDGIPEACRTAVVVPALVARPEDVDALLIQLELHYLANPDPSLVFVLLTDHVDSTYVPDDEALLTHAEQQLSALNERHGTAESKPFHLLHRDTSWNEAEGHFMGWERKRGKLEELNRLLRGDRSTGFRHHLGASSGLGGVRFVLTLDADTRLPLGAAQRLVGLLAHPLNHAEFDARTGRVVSGYTVVQPRVEPSPLAQQNSWFSRVFVGDTAIDIYTRAVSDVYQDLFGSGVYIGKGIYELDTFMKSLGTVPENSLASHDLFEGIHGRVALATDIAVYEEYPHHYLAFARRLHRWIRGDWQLLPWVLPRLSAAKLPRPNLRLIDRWKIVDNLRRSLLSPSLLCLIVLGWLVDPEHAGAWSLAALALPLLISLPALAGARPQDAISRWAFGAALLPYEATQAADAIVRVLARMAITRKHLLEWVTAADTARLLGRRSACMVFWREMRWAIVLSGGLMLGVGVSRPSLLLPLAPLFAIWLLSPEIARLASAPRYDARPLDLAERRALRHLARRTWLFFESYVGPADQWLPPDNFQQEPGGKIAHRTSPTNIGLLLTAQLSARDLGYVGPAELSALLHHTLQSLARLERYRGHWLNWYDTRTGEPLPPRYVSTVDSGNLAAALITIAKGCKDQAEAPLVGAVRWEGLRDTFDLLEAALDPLLRVYPALSEPIAEIRSTLERGREPSSDCRSLLHQLSESLLPRVEQALLKALEHIADQHEVLLFREARTWLERLAHQLRGLRGDVETFFPWLALVDQARIFGLQLDPELPCPSTLSLQATRQTCVTLRGTLRAQRDDTPSEVTVWLEQAELALQAGEAHASQLLAELEALAEQAETAWLRMDFAFLYNPTRKLFRIGYNVSSDRLDSNYYDLLASEARLASFLAIVLKQVPPTHWYALGRPVTRIRGSAALLSWGGSMFEYLLPSVFMRSAERTLLSRSEQLAVLAHIDYGKSAGVPWGISESGYAELDAQGNYRYRSFGVPALALKRGLEDDLVVAPYACVLALALNPRQVMENLAAFERLGAVGLYGLFEAVDYHPSRGEEAIGEPLGATRSFAIVRSYMAHHQGMVFAALNNALSGNALIARFHANPLVKSGELLLSERLPSLAVEQPPTTASRDTSEATVTPRAHFPTWSPEPEATAPAVALLSNGRLSTLISDTGAGWMRWKELAISGGAPDPTCDDEGHWIYLRDQQSGRVWSATPAPTRGRSPDDQVAFHPHKAEFHHREAGISLRTEIAIAPLDDVEIRYLTLHNETSQERKLMVVSQANPILETPPGALRHPAFSRMFIECEALSEHRVLASRRKKSPEEAGAVLVQQALWESGSVSWLGGELDRASFLGRRRDARHPRLKVEELGNGTTGDRAGLDPTLALALEVTLEPSATVKLAFVSAVGSTRAKALSAARRFGSLHAAKWAIRDAERQAARRLERDGMTPDFSRAAAQLVSRLLVPGTQLLAAKETLLSSNPSKPQLWGHGISGDHPLLVVRVRDPDSTALVTELLAVYRHLRTCRVPIELVFLDAAASGYQADPSGGIRRALVRTGTDAWLQQRAGIFVLANDQLAPEALHCLEAAATVFIDGERGALHEQLLNLPHAPLPPPRFSGAFAHSPEPARAPPEPKLLGDNGYGGFTENGHEYVIRLTNGRSTPAPWCNVLANARFGCLVSESSLGSTWCENAGENRLTPWRNDPISDTPSEVLYLRDEETGHVWSSTPLPAGLDADTLVRHGAGYTVYERDSHGLSQTLTVFVPCDQPVKILRLRLHNHLDRRRRLTSTYYVEWVLGALQGEQRPHIRSELNSAEQCILAKNSWNTEFGAHVAFVAADRALHGFTSDRNEFIGRSGSLSEPEALRRWGLAGCVEPGVDPCAALQTHLELGPDETLELHFVLGQASDASQAIELVRRFRQPAEVEKAWNALADYWHGVLGAVQVKTPEPELDLMLNRWLLYQSLSSRFLARSGFYQSSGAFGFRDQLQDVMAFAMVAPSLTRAHLLEAATHQFEEGDVLHWWHPPLGRGVRTRCSDDLLWLPFVLAHYVTATGDTSILAEQVAFLRAPPLNPGEHDRYAEFARGPECADLLEHCRRALARGLSQGPHGLPLIGDGDWNDGMNRVGAAGRGESVWLGWFTCATIEHFASLLERVGLGDESNHWRERSAALKKAIEQVAWDGAWYLRAFYDDGSPLGSALSASCQIDSIAQSWAVLSGAADEQRARRALRSADERLVRADERLVLLLEPAFRGARHDPGYIAAYPLGVRENGGQYTHAAAWLGWAHARLGDGAGAAQIFRLLNPLLRTQSAAAVERYRVEPYVLAGDICSIAPFTGRGGWTWYTGAAAWTWRLGVEAMLGLYPEQGGVRFAPCIPPEWPGFEATLRLAGREIHVVVDNPDRVSGGVRRLTLNGVALTSPLVLFTGEPATKLEVHIVLGDDHSKRDRGEPPLIASSSHELALAKPGGTTPRTQ
ncbi:MAG TPA: glucoamylase family protein [Polyangiaceae bacterium]